ncbi:MAG: phosphoribosylformylglycinamidine synthase subunit PurL [Candidatus Mycalebacterium zealandia]|nr:MAG: phosphoribosylformylglycinamidine synthase subunit PurL [Candidatus Mycalebacterium zealandia]
MPKSSDKPEYRNGLAAALEHGLSEPEYLLIKEQLGREPNTVEIGILGAMWSEHCSYKHSKIHLRKFPTKGKAVIHGPGENAGVMDIGDGDCVVFKMESHNHPSFIEPYQGAATGVGGILRDVFTMGARPVAILNSLRFGNPQSEKTKFLVEGVVSGIAGYGNCVGVPTVGGEVDFDDCYNGNPIVNVFAVGIAKKDGIFTGHASGVGNPVVYVGSKTGKDGIKGAVMASDVFDNESSGERPTVQIGDPFTEKLLIESCLELFKLDAVIGIQDMGAAGLTSSSAEMASRGGNGIKLECEKIPLREKAMTPYEIMLSESQERMLMVLKKGKENQARKVFEKWGLDFSVIGEVNGEKNLTLMENGKTVGEIPIDLIIEPPEYDSPVKTPASFPAPTPLRKGGEKDSFLKILSSPFCASKHWIYRQYDYMVGANTAEAPGSDCSLILVDGTSKALALSADCNSRYCMLNPREGAKAAVAESARNIACSGAKPLGITDCLNFGNPENPEIMWQFKEAIEGISEAAKHFSTPVVSGNVSLYNETAGVSINPTPVVGMVGLLENVSKAVGQYFMNEGDMIFIAGDTFEEMGGSLYSALIQGKTTGEPPVVNLESESRLVSALIEAANKCIINSAHDISEGGLAVALAESCFSPQSRVAGFSVSTGMLNPEIQNGNAILFSETQARAIISTSPENEEKISKVFKSHKVTLKKIGNVTTNNVMEFKDVFKTSADEAMKLWLEGFEKNVIL